MSWESPEASNARARASPPPKSSKIPPWNGGCRLPIEETLTLPVRKEKQDHDRRERHGGVARRADPEPSLPATRRGGSGHPGEGREPEDGQNPSFGGLPRSKGGDASEWRTREATGEDEVSRREQQGHSRQANGHPVEERPFDPRGLCVASDKQ